MNTKNMLNTYLSILCNISITICMLIVMKNEINHTMYNNILNKPSLISKNSTEILHKKMDFPLHIYPFHSIGTRKILRNLTKSTSIHSNKRF